MVEVAAQAQKEVLPQEAGTCSLPFPCSPSFVSLIIFFNHDFVFFFLGVDAGTKGLEPIIAEEAKRLAPSV